MAHKYTCTHCHQPRVLPRYEYDSDMVQCTNCWNFTPSGRESAIRKVQEAWAGKEYRDYPKVAVGRAIGYASGIYRLATHGEQIKTAKVEQRLQDKFGKSATVDTDDQHQLQRKMEFQVDDRKVTCSDQGVGVVVMRVRGDNWAHIYVVFRGSRGEHGDTNPNSAGWAKVDDEVHCMDWLANLRNNTQAPPDWLNTVKVQPGFLELYMSVRDDLKRSVDQLAANQQNVKVIVTGHSLGAALSTLCAHHLDITTNYRPLCFTFSSPRVGNLNFVRDFNWRIARQQTVLHSEPVPKYYFRAFAFQRSSDPVSNGVEQGYLNPIRGKVADLQKKYGPTLGVIAQAKNTVGKKTSKAVIYYHIQNRVSLGWRGPLVAHDFDKIEGKLLGKKVHK